MKNLKSYLLHYSEGAGASAFNGGVIAVSAALGKAVAVVAGATVALPNLHEISSTFWGAAFLAAVVYFQRNPIPVVPTGSPATDAIKSPLPISSPATAAANPPAAAIVVNPQAGVPSNAELAKISSP